MIEAVYHKLKTSFEYIFEDELLKEISDCGTIKSFPANYEIMTPGNEIKMIPIVMQGSVKVMKEDKKGEELLLYYLEPGETCAVTLKCCTKNTKSSITVLTETETEIIFIPSTNIEKWMIKYKSWRNYLFDSYHDRLHELFGAIDNIVFHSMEERLEKYIKDKSMVAKNNVINITHQQIANDLHSSRVVISRLTKKLEKRGVIKQSRNSIKYCI